MMPGLTLKKIDPEKINQDIYTVYDQIMHEYDKTKAMIPEGHLVELSYDDLTADTMAEIKRIYDTFGFDGFDMAGPLIEAYADQKKGYVRNKYAIKQSLLDEILAKTSFTMKQYGYKIPDNLEITD
jgi:hypothetical protein